MIHIRMYRHPPVHSSWHGKCYGFSDVPLAEGWDWSSIVPPVRCCIVQHSGLLRTQQPAEQLARIWGVASECDHRLRERNYGSWEGISWEAIYAATGDAMMGSVLDPENWAPAGGETTFAVRDRVLHWWNEWCGSKIDQTVVVVTHGGVIASLSGTLDCIPVINWPGLVPKCGEFRDFFHPKR